MTETPGRLLRRMMTLPLVLLWVASSAAHDVPIEEAVTIDITPAPTQLNVAVQLPIAALGDANLPRDDNRRLAHPAADKVLEVVARDIANRLDLQLAGVPLVHDAGRVTMPDNEQAVGFVFNYPVTADANSSLSANIQAYRAGARPLKAIVRYHDADGASRTFTVTSGSERILFAPGIVRVIRDFAVRAFRAAAGNVDALLFLLALAVPLRAATTRRTAVLTFFVAQTAAAVIAGLLPLPGNTAAVASVLAASALVVIAIQNVVAVQSDRVAFIAIAFGLFNGVSLAAIFRGQSEFAGNHPAVALEAFVLALTLAQVWVMALAGLGLSLVTGRGVPATWLSWGASIYAGHEALHLVADRLRLVPAGSWSLDELGLLLVAGWILATILVGVADSRRQPAVFGAGVRRS